MRFDHEQLKHLIAEADQMSRDQAESAWAADFAERVAAVLRLVASR